MTQRQLESQNEFIAAKKAETTFRHSAARYLARISASGRLMSKMHEVVMSDDLNPRGSRVFLPAKASRLKQTNLGQNSVQSLLNSIFSLKIETDATQKKAALNFNIDMVPAIDLKKPAGATHAEITVVHLAIDFNNPDNLPIVREQKESYALTSTLPVSTIETTLSDVPVDYVNFALLQVSYSQEVNSVRYPLESKSLNAVYIADVLV